MKIAVLLSGGVDSSVSLKLLKNQGHDITAFYLKIWLEDELSYLGHCPWEEDLRYVRQVCEQEEVPLKVVSLQKEYHEQVVGYTIAQVRSGRTPNPDVLCNQRIKFGMALKHIGPEFDKIATGHYAIAREIEGRTQLFRAADPVKDQTYFLSYLNQDQLGRVLFPIGHLPKEKVRQLAHEFKLPNSNRKDSQGICFLGKLKFSEFLHHYLGEKTGDLVEIETGTVMGQHKGFWYYTIGQRQGLGLAGGPWYVSSKNTEKNVVYISRNYYSKNKKRDTFVVQDCNWLSGKQPTKNNLQVKMRHGANMYNAQVEFLPNNSAQVKLFGRDQGIAPGQFTVFYDGDVCLGAGVIATEQIKK